VEIKLYSFLIYVSTKSDLCHPRIAQKRHDSADWNDILSDRSSW